MLLSWLGFQPGLSYWQSGVKDCAGRYKSEEGRRELAVDKSYLGSTIGPAKRLSRRGPHCAWAVMAHKRPNELIATIRR